MNPDIERMAKEVGIVFVIPPITRVELTTFTDWRTGVGRGMGRKRVFDEAGVLISDETSDLGSRIYWNDSPEPVGWFRGLIAAIRTRFPMPALSDK